MSDDNKAKKTRKRTFFKHLQTSLWLCLVQNVSVFGVNHDEWGETPIAAVILKNGFFLETHEIKNFANDNLEARYQKITDVFFVEDFPKNVAGKILKRELKENYLNDVFTEKN